MGEKEAIAENSMKNLYDWVFYKPRVRRRGLRIRGINPRIKGTNPRAKGTNPRALREKYGYTNGFTNKDGESS
jgi:hypothetical protein